MLRVVPPTPARIDPLLKWAGGKRWFVREFGDDMFKRVLERGGRYIEPFLGGGAMALHLGIQGMILGDIEEELIITYLVIRDFPDELSVLLELLESTGTNKENYYQVRAKQPGSPVEAAARLIYLNKLCYNGLYRKNRSGVFNVPFGGSRPLPSRDRIHEVSTALTGAEIRCCTAIELIDRARENDILYVDPPYHGTFSDYTSRGFSEDDHKELAEALLRAHQRGTEVYAHNSATQLIKNLYSWAEILIMGERRNVNSKGQGRGKVDCVLIAGVDCESKNKRRSSTGS